MGKILKYFGIITLLLLLSRPPQAAADNSAGTVLAARRTAWSDRKASELLSKNPIFTGELLTTNQVGRLQVLFHDDSILMMAPDTQTRITEYLYSGGAEGNISLDLARGVTRIISGKVTEEGGMIHVKTPEASVGIRGTDVLIRSNPDGVTEVAVLQGSDGRPTAVCLPGMASGDCFQLSHRQGVIINGRRINRMDGGVFNNFYNTNNPNKETGVAVAEYIPPQVAPAPGSAQSPAGPGGAGASGRAPEPAEQPMNTKPPRDPFIPLPPPGPVNASYSGTLNHAGGYGSSMAVSGGFNYQVSDINGSNPTLSSVNFYATVMDGAYYKATYQAKGAPNVPVTNGTDFSVLPSNVNVTTTFQMVDSSSGALNLGPIGADSTIQSVGKNVTWDVTVPGHTQYDTSLDGTATRD